MGFLDSLGKAAGKAVGSLVNSVEKKQESISHYRDEFERQNLSVDKLIYKAKHGSGDEQIAAASILNDMKKQRERENDDY